MRAGLRPMLSGEAHQAIFAENGVALAEAGNDWASTGCGSTPLLSGELSAVCGLLTSSDFQERGIRSSAGSGRCSAATGTAPIWPRRFCVGEKRFSPRTSGSVLGRTCPTASTMRCGSRPWTGLRTICSTIRKTDMRRRRGTFFSVCRIWRTTACRGCVRLRRWGLHLCDRKSPLYGAG